MHKHTIGYYLDQAGGSLLPPDTMLKGIVNSDWWTTLSDYFDDLIWQYFLDRQIFINDKFPIENEAATLQNIKRAFAINLKAKAFKYKRLYDIAIAEYNPLYNVDATEHTERDLKQEGSGSHALSGTDTNTTSGSEDFEKFGSEANTKSGSETFEKSGEETNTKTGSETDTKAGSETTTKSGSKDISYDGGSDEKVIANTTFDDATFRDVSKETTTPGAKQTETYNSVADELSFSNDREDEHTYNDVTDSLTFNQRQDETTYNDVKDELTFENRKDTHTYNDVETETEYGRTDTEQRNFNDFEVTDHRRFGNIGVTKSQDLAESEFDLWSKSMDWMKLVVRECINCVSYAIY